MYFTLTEMEKSVTYTTLRAVKMWAARTNFPGWKIPNHRCQRRIRILFGYKWTNWESEYRLQGNNDSQQRTCLQNFVLYYGVIYALGKADNFIYSMPSNPSSDSSSTAAPTSSASPAPTSGTEEDASKENVLISEACRNFVVDSDWIYVLNDGGIARYLVDGSGKRYPFSTSGRCAQCL